MHTLFVREHNYWAGVIAKANPALGEDEIYESARAIVGGEMQVITYREFLPLLLGQRRYRPIVDIGLRSIPVLPTCLRRRPIASDIRCFRRNFCVWIVV